MGGVEVSDPMLDEPVWCVVDWITGERCEVGYVKRWRLDDAREALAAIGVPGLRVARWDDGRWVEAPEPEPEPVTAREVIATRLRDQVLVAGGGRSHDAADAALAALSDAGFRVVACTENEVPVVLRRRDAAWWGQSEDARPGANRIMAACRAALAAAGEGDDG